MIMQAYDHVGDAELSLRTMLETCSAMRRDRVFTASRFDTGSMEDALERMIGRGEIETIRPLYTQARHPCYYRLRRETDGQHEARPHRQRTRPIGRSIGHLALEFT